MHDDGLRPVSYTHLDVYKRQHEVKSFISRAVGAVSDCENDRTPDAETENDAVSAEEETTVSLKKSKAYRISEMLTQHFKVYSCLLYTSRCV